MKILISGSSGFVGSALQSYLTSRGDSIVRLVRNEKEMGPDTLLWHPEKDQIDLKNLEGFDAVINLAGDNIANGRWNDERKKNILSSRVNTTYTLAKSFRKLAQRPKVFINASAIGYYGNRGDILCTEETSQGTGFLPKVCREWEEATQPAKSAKVRTAILRFGVVLSPKGGALAKMLTPFKLGLGGILGSGNQYMSWVSIDELLDIILFTIKDETLDGPINVVAPHPITNRYFTTALGKILHRPTILSVPAFALRLIMGQEMADELLLSSTRVIPHKLLNAGYHFKHPNLEEALHHLLK